MNRKGFLKTLMTGIGALTTGLALAKDSKKSSTGKVKMMTSEGKLVEIEKSKLDMTTTTDKASAGEVFAWMKHK